MLSFEINTEDNIQQIIISGQLEGIEALEFRNSISEVFEDNISSMLVDIQAVSKIDLTGFNALLMLKNEVDQRSMLFQIIVPSNGPIDDFLHLSKLDLNKTVASS